MKGIKCWVLIGLMLSIGSSFYGGAFAPGIYGNFEGTFEDQTTKAVVTNSDWKLTSVAAYFELKLSGRNIEGFDVWTKLGANIDFDATPLSGDFLSTYFASSGILAALKAGNANNFQFKQFEVHIQRVFDLWKDAKANIAFYRGENRTEVNQPYLDFFGDLGDGETKVGLSWDAWGLFGLYFKGFLVDYRSDFKDTNSNPSDPYAYAMGFRTGSTVLKKPFLNIAWGATFGASQYMKTYTISGTYGIASQNFVNQYYYNVFGADVTMNGDIPLVGSYYLFGAFGRSYTPENYPYENNQLIGVTGNSNAMIYVMELKYNRKLEFGTLDLGQIYLGAYLYGRQPNYQTYMGGGGDNNFNETLNFTYSFPVKQIAMNGNMVYYHNYANFDVNKYHIFQVGKITDTSATFKTHLDMNVMFSGGFSFNIAWDKEAGNTYLGSFVPEGIDYLTFSVAGEGTLGKISPQLKIVALGDSAKQLLSSGIEIFLNLSSWLKFYSRFAFVQSAGYWKSGSEVNWWTAFIQFQFYTGNNSKFYLELGDGGHTDSGFVSDRDLINGASFKTKVYCKFEYWY